MYQFYVVEIKKTKEGEYEHSVTWYFDAKEQTAQYKAESAYHEILSRAAVSDFAEHAAILFSSRGFPLLNFCYVHA